MIDFEPWTTATTNLLPGQQRVFHDFLSLVAEGKAHLVYGADYRDGKPCLVNGTAQMLSHTSMSPMQNFPQVVSAFDNLCAQMEQKGLCEDGLKGYVSPVMAEFLLRNFGDLKPIVLENTVSATENLSSEPYVEASDAQMQEFLASMSAPAPEDIVDADKHDVYTDYARSFINVERP